MKLIPKEFEGFNRVLTGVVVPRPIALVSTVSHEGVVNLAPFSFFNAIAYDPPTLVLGISRSAGWKAKDTLANIEATGEFVVNVVVDDIAAAMNATAAEYPADVDEFQVSGLDRYPVRRGAPARSSRIAREYGMPPQSGNSDWRRRPVRACAGHRRDCAYATYATTSSAATALTTAASSP